MKDTVKLFYEDSFISEFEASVLSCEPWKDGYKAGLDRTAFFPEGGGQYGDTGWLNGIEVTDTQEKDGKIFHFLAEPLKAGETVSGRLDWEARFGRMQQHSGEHIVSGIVHRRFGYDNVGFHLGADYCTMDFNGPITNGELEEIEREANRVVCSDLAVHVLYPAKEELGRMEYRSKIEIEGQVRMIEIPGVDRCACCAPHVARTGQIGLIKFTDMTNYKGGERIRMLCGFRALSDYRSKQGSVRMISRLLCEQEGKIGEAVNRLKEDNTALKGEIARLQRQILGYKAEKADDSGEIVWVFDGDLAGDGPRELMNLLLEQGAEIGAVFSGTDETGYRYVIGSRSRDVRPLNQRLKERFGARGGGKPEMVQGSLAGSGDQIKALLS